MKKQIFLVSFLLFFLRLQIYEAIAAIFWQSASYAFFCILISSFSCTFFTQLY